MADFNVTPENVVDVVQQERMALLFDKDAHIDKDRLALMKDLSKTAMDQSRLGVEKDAANSNSELAAGIAMAIMSGGSQQPFKVQERVEREINVPETALPDEDISDLELSTEPADFGLEEIMK